MSDQSIPGHDANQVKDSNSTSGLTLLDLLIALGADKKMFFFLWALGVSVTIGVVLMLPRSYSASAVMLPPQSQQNAGLNISMLAQLGPFASLAGGASGFKTPDGMYIELFKTRRLQD
ncbi:MAG TPA: Wzz/FepE/Etk N-terminal domain-containing protein, partial [Aquabacterium sp.]|nr:Wzz/FepE/Etk N-terminal domain-containing protein [Aquabacterium sp.]